MRQAADEILAKASQGERISPREALVLYRHAPLAKLGRVAFGIKLAKSGDKVFYNNNIHIEPSNVCIVKCAFCSYHRDQGSEGSWVHTPEQMERMAREGAQRGITEIHIVGGIDPERGFGYCLELIRRIKAAAPKAAVKAFTAAELAVMIRQAGLTVEEGLSQLKQAGMEAIAGGGAEIFDQEVRSQICPNKIGMDEWLALHETAHKLGISSNATMLYGHIETPEHRIAHLAALRGLQDRTGGFNAFIPLKFRAMNNSLSHLGEVGITEDIRVLALSRIMLDNFDHIKAYWPMYGKTAAEIALSFGADDLDGTIDGTTKIYTMAGEHDSGITVAYIRKMAAGAGLQAVERDTHYNIIDHETTDRLD